MSQKITVEEIKDNSYFWYMYLKWFRGFDDENEINLDEALEIIAIDQKQVHQWEDDFFTAINEENIKYIDEKLSNGMSIHIEFQENEILFFLNETYIGNLGGHFEAWFLTWAELLSFEKYPYLFMLLLPMTGIEKQQIKEAGTIITKHLKTIPKFEKDAPYITNCIVNGLAIEGGFLKTDDIGTTTNQNHSVRNIEAYPRYKDGVRKLNIELKRFGIE